MVTGASRGIALGGAIVNVASIAGLGATGVRGWYAVARRCAGRRQWLR